MILKDLRPKDIKTLKEKTFVHWRGYRIEHIPHKWFSVSGLVKFKKVSCRIQDMFSFFATSFVKALRVWGVGTDEEIDYISAGKDKRGDFQLSTLDSEVRPYWTSELLLMVDLGNRLRDILYSAGITIDKWFGPGNIATHLYKKHETQKHMDKNLRPEILEASQYAYAGGRFEGFRAGLIDQPVYAADINSAYPSAIATLPSLSSGSWQHTTDVAYLMTVPTLMGMYRVRFTFVQGMLNDAYTNGFPFPVFSRRPTGQVWYPSMTESWYHAPEFKLLVDWYQRSNGNAFRRFEVIEAWLYHDDGSKPFAWVEDMYNQRAEWKAKGEPAEKALKLGLNSLYGKMAQRIGSKDGKSPVWHQLEWAGHVTSHARAQLYNAMLGCGDSLIAVETDGIYATRPFTNLPGGTGKELGQWGLDDYDGMLFLQNGVYWLKEKGQWKPPKTRGIPQKRMDITAAMESLRQGIPLRATQNSFIGYGIAYHRDRNNMRNWRTWQTSEKSFDFGGNGKRLHKHEKCNACNTGRPFADSIHTLSLAVAPPILGSERSHKHYIPWLENAPFADLEEMKHNDRWDVEE